MKEEAVARVRPQQVCLAKFTTLGVGGFAELWEVESLSDLRKATLEDYRVIGGGSNLLISDEGVFERVIKLGQNFNSITTFTGKTDLWLGAATPLPGLVRRASKLGLSGFEGLLGIPAVLGGAIAMNAGTRFGEICDTLQEVELFTGKCFERLPAAALNMHYRHCELPKGAIITRGRFKLTPSTPEKVQAYLTKVDKARQGQPKVKSAGCAFKNPEGDSAGRLIDAAGLKGLRVGQAIVSHEHGNFIVNLGGATAKDIIMLLEKIQKNIEIPLAIEWQYWGHE